MPRPVTPASILAAQLEALAAEAEGPLRSRLAAARDLAAGLDPYVADCTSPESDGLRALAERTAAQDWSGTGVEEEMLSGHVEGAALAAFVRLSRARRVLEIGMFTGYGALAMAEALPDGGEVVALELDPDVAAIASAAFESVPGGDRIRVMVGPAAASLEALAGETFDLVFVDADKAGYLGYVDTVLETGLLASGGAILVDNTLMQGLPWGAGEPTANGDAIRDFNAAIAADARVRQVLLPLRDGLTVIQRA